MSQASRACPRALRCLCTFLPCTRRQDTAFNMCAQMNHCCKLGGQKLHIISDSLTLRSLPTSRFSVFLTLFISLSLSLYFPQTAAYWHVLQHVAECVVGTFSSSVSPGRLLNDLIPWLFFVLLSPPFSITALLLWLFMCQRDQLAQLLMIQPTDLCCCCCCLVWFGFFIPTHQHCCQRAGLQMPTMEE